MTAATLNKINAQIAKHGIEVVKGGGYFYFAATEGAIDAAQQNADAVPSVYSDVLRCMSLEDWIAHVEDHLREGGAGLTNAQGEDAAEFARHVTRIADGAKGRVVGYQLTADRLVVHWEAEDVTHSIRTSALVLTTKED